MFHFFTKLADTVANAKPNKLRLFADENELFKTKNSLGVVRTLGNAVRSIEYQSTDGLVDTYLVKTDDFEFEFPVANGRSITSLTKVGTVGLISTYRVEFNDGPSFDFHVEDGRGIANIEAPANAGQPDSTDTYTVRYNDGTTSTFIVRNGRDGVDGVVTSVNGKSEPNIILTAADVGAVPAAALGVTVATLIDGAVPAAQLPAFVDDVLEFDAFGLFPAIGERGKIYVDLTDGNTYRWSGSQYIEISKAPVFQVNGKVGNVTLTTSDIAEGTNLYFTAQRVRDTILTGLSLATNAAITAADSVLSAFGKLQKQLSDHFAAVDPHPQYTTDAEATTIAQGRVTAHEQLPDPHPQYTTTAEASAAAPVQSVSQGAGISVNTTTGNVVVTNADRGTVAVAAHEQAADPHPQYTTAAEAQSAASAAVATHEQSADPHPQYLTTAEAQALIPPNKLSARISTLFASTANSTAVQIVLSLAIPSGYLTQGKSFDFDLEGTQSQSAAATNVVGAIFVNNTQLVSAAVAGGTAAQTNRSIRMKGGIMWNGANYLGNITTAISGVLPVGNANVTGVAVAAATAHNIDIRVQTSTANAANIIRAMVAAIKEI